MVFVLSVFILSNFTLVGESGDNPVSFKPISIMNKRIRVRGLDVRLQMLRP